MSLAFRKIALGRPLLKNPLIAISFLRNIPHHWKKTDIEYDSDYGQEWGMVIPMLVLLEDELRAVNQEVLRLQKVVKRCGAEQGLQASDPDV